METELDKTSFAGAVQYAKACVCRDDVVLKSKQVEVLKVMYQGKDCFVWFPTGYGKSLCYQLLPFLLDHKRGRIGAPQAELSVVIVVSPLVSLMVDQVSSLHSRGISAAILSGNSGVDKKCLANEGDSQYRFLYSCPEAIVAGQRWKQFLLEPSLSDTVVAVAVDEVHCVYKWQVLILLYVECV